MNGADFYAAQILANLGDDRVAAILRAVGAPVHAGNLEPARTHIIRGMGQGAESAQRAFDEDVLDAPVPAAVLTVDLGPRMVSPVQIVQPLWQRQEHQPAPVSRIASFCFTTNKGAP